MQPRRFELSVGTELVPGLIWARSDREGPWPTVLMGHGRGGYKGNVYNAASAFRLVVEHGLAVVELDAPGHGERRSPDLAADEMPPHPDPEQVVPEWRACIDLLVADGVIEPSAIGYWGFSMGAGMGIALLAAEPRIRCAVLGLMHDHYYPRIIADAAAISCPVTFSIHWDDVRVPRDQACALFGAIGAADKRLHAYPGDHTDWSDEEVATAEAFIASRLRF